VAGAETAAQLDLDQLTPEWNANVTPPRTLAKIRRSIVRFGFVENLVARPHPTLEGKYEVISGNHRLALCRELGINPVPVVIRDYDDIEARLLAEAINNLGGEHDPVRYAQLLEQVLEAEGRESVLEVLPETESSIDRALGALRVRDLTDPDDAPEPPAKPTSRRGEVYELGPHRLLCGDATDAGDLETLMGGVASLVLTDPPYGVSYEAETRPILNDDLAGDALEAFLVAALERARDVADAGAPIYVWHSDGQGEIFRRALRLAGWSPRQTLVWVKHHFVLGRQDYQWQHEPILYGWNPGAAHRWYGGREEATVIDDDVDLRALSKPELVRLVDSYRTRDNTTVLRADKPTTADLHPTMKPVWLLRHLMHNSSCRGDIVLDPFGGSGSTLIAAEQSGRRCFTLELDPGYCDVIRRRYETFAGAR